MYFNNHDFQPINNLQNTFPYATETRFSVFNDLQNSTELLIKASQVKV